MRTIYLLLALCLVVASAPAANAVAWFDSGGFEGYALGALDGQNGWVGGANGTGFAPNVVTAPHPTLGNQAVQLAVCDLQGDTSHMEIGITDPLAARYTIVTVSFDIYRTGVVQNLWWYWWDNGEPTYGLQWDMNQATLPHGWNPGAGSAPTVFNSYATLTMEWNFDTMKAYSWYNGALVDDGIPINGITALTGWTIYLAHDADTGTGADCVYIDNFVITAVPEPGSILALASGLIGLGGLAIRRRR